MKMYYYRLLIITLGILILSCSEDEHKTYFEPAPDSITLTESSETATNSDQIDIWNGALVKFKLNGNSGPYREANLSIRNSSNQKVEVGFYAGDIYFKTSSFEDQNAKFDIYYEETKLRSLQVTVKTFYKLQGDGRDIKDKIVLDLTTGAAPKEFKLLLKDGSEVPDFSIENFSFFNIHFNEDKEVEISPGNNFALYYPNYIGTSKDIISEIYYFSKKENINILITTVEIKANVTKNCYYVEESSGALGWSGYYGDVISSSVDRYYVADGKIQRNFNQRRDGTFRFYYEGELLTEVYSEKNGRASAKYKYNNNLIQQVQIFGINGSQLKELRYTYNDQGNLSTYVSYELDNSELKLADSIVYKNYDNKNPLRTEEYGFFGYKTEFIRYYTNEYDNIGNINRQFISKNDTDYVLYLERTFDQNEKFLQIFDKSTGRTFTNKPVMLSESYYTNGGVTPTNEPVRAARILDIQKDEEDRVIGIGVNYSFRHTGVTEVTNFWKLEYSNCDN